MTYKVNREFIAVATEYTTFPMDSCPVGVDVMLENPSGVLVRGRWDGRSKVWKSWFPFPKLRKDDDAAPPEKEPLIEHKEYL